MMQTATEKKEFAALSVDVATMNRPWQRNVPLFRVPLLTRSFAVLCGLGALACVLALYREAVGLGPASGMNDSYAWGVWKTFNIMVLTGLGSGSFAIGIAVWIFGQRQLHAVMRTAVLSSFLTYASGLALLGVDVGRPWNFYSILMPWRWNAHSPMLEIAFCMPLYTAVPLLIENLPAALEALSKRLPRFAFACDAIEAVIRRIFPFVLALGFLLPAMHQSSLGALMLLAGPQVHPLWQTPLLPLLYVGAAGFMGFAFVTFILLVAHLVWERPLDREILRSMCRISTGIVAVWLALRALDLLLRGSLPLAFTATAPALLFWIETTLLIAAAIAAYSAARQSNPRRAFLASMLACVGGMLYRFDPTTLVYQPGLGASYFPSLIEIVITVGFVAAAIAAFCVVVKLTAILPASLETWFEAERAEQHRKLHRQLRLVQSSIEYVAEA
jgi:Ni/Fe-hydrogenase subunit HybB-like protein